MKDTTIIITILIIAALSVLGFSIFQESPLQLGATADLAYSGNATNTSSTIGTATVPTSTILGVDSSRNFASICNNGPAITYLCFHEDTCTFGSGIALVVSTNASSTDPCFSINRNNLYTGIVIGVVDGTATTTVSVTEK